MHSVPGPTGAAAAAFRPGLARWRLVFDHASRLWGVEAALVAGVVEYGAVRPVPGAPPAVLGLCEWRGILLTVLDLPVLAGIGATAGARRLLRLAEPCGRLALSVPASVRLEAITTVGGAERIVEREGEGAPVRFLDAAGAVARLEAQLRGRA
jgi:hypothetical protein